MQTACANSCQDGEHVASSRVARTACDRLDISFSLVAPVARCSAPRSIRPYTCAVINTCCQILECGSAACGRASCAHQPPCQAMAVTAANSASWSARLGPSAGTAVRITLAWHCDDLGPPLRGCEQPTPTGRPHKCHACGPRGSPGWCARASISPISPVHTSGSTAVKPCTVRPSSACRCVHVQVCRHARMRPRTGSICSCSAAAVPTSL